VLAPCRSVYRWQAGVEETSEVPLLIKTTRARYADLERTILDAHPFRVPEIIALPVTQGLPDYLDWVQAETRAPNPPTR
jgi:periplasmic divalent cation tolerance protein